jgi:hypothetical protein
MLRLSHKTLSTDGQRHTPISQEPRRRERSQTASASWCPEPPTQGLGNAAAGDARLLACKVDSPLQNPLALKTPTPTPPARPRQRQRLVAVFRKRIAEFLKQHSVGVEDVRHALQLTSASTIFLSSRSNRIAKAAVPKCANLRSDEITAAMRARSLGEDWRLIASSNTSDICGPLR